ncbi:MAG: hypothetical protein AAGN66_19430 [Acidobacteriota bacterium]
MHRASTFCLQPPGVSFGYYVYKALRQQDLTTGDMRALYAQLFQGQEIPLDGDYFEESPDLDYLLSYWMGRYYGVF